MHFEIIGKIENQETFATGKAIRELPRLQKADGESGRGVAQVKLANGSIVQVELHWYEATGIGTKEFKIKRYLS